jgi:hypothetical protein
MNVANEAGAGFTKFFGACSLPWCKAEIKAQSKKGRVFLGRYFEGAEIMAR